MHKIIQLIYPVAICFLLSLILADIPLWSYAIAWGGSFLLFYRTWFSSKKMIDTRLSLTQQVMRPIVLSQFIFAAFMCCTSLFYVMDLMGYKYLEKVNEVLWHNQKQLALVAKCQRLSFLGHIALVTGILSTNTSTKAKKFTFKNTGNQLHYTWLKVSLILYGLSIAFQFIPGLLQFYLYSNNIAIFSASILFLKGLTEKKLPLLAYGAAIFGANFIAATLSGFKEQILVNVIILFGLLLPYYKRTILLLALPTAYILLYILPMYAAVFRSEAWSGANSVEEARATAFETILQNENTDEIVETNWTFLTNRLSEINMFTQYAEYVPSKRPYYGWEILENSIIAMVPRVLYPEKGITEEIAMERVYEAGIVHREANVSAKTRPVVDAYLSFGYTGVFTFLFALGFLTQYLNNTAERWFGGYEFGCVVMFNASFQVLWRGNNFEFMLNNILYGFVTMWLVFLTLRKLNIIIPKR